MEEMKVWDLQCNYMQTPLGLDSRDLTFSWKLESDEPKVLQRAYRILVEQNGEQVYDSGLQASGILHCQVSLALRPCTRYVWRITVHDSLGRHSQGESWFETGLLCGSMDAWDGAVWIGAPEVSLYGDTTPVYAIETDFQFTPESRTAGLCFGIGDARLKERRMNEMRVAGESAIAYVVDMTGERPLLKIYRTGYTAGDQGDVPLAVVPVVRHGTEEEILTGENWEQVHCLRVEVTGGKAVTYLDGTLVDQVPVQRPEIQEGMEIEGMPEPEGFTGRCLNPLGDSNCPLYPMLCKIGVQAEGATRFLGLRVQNLRYPGSTVFEAFHEPLLLEGEHIVDPSHGGAAMLRRRFSLEEKPERARLYVACRGIYAGSMNGCEMDDTWFDNGAAQYDKHMPYRVYAVEDMLRCGENVLAFTLASGWYTKGQSFGMENYNYWGDRESLLVKLELTWADGRRQVLVSDREWKCSCAGPVRDASFFQGETYDNRLSEQCRGWATPGFDDANWAQAAEIPLVCYPVSGMPEMWPCPNQTEPELMCYPDSVVRVWQEKPACEKREIEPGVYLFDFGQNLVGVPKVRLFGQRGDTAVLRYGEVLYPENEPEFAAYLMTENLREATSIDRFIFAGAETGELFVPKFTFHGFRYLKISGVSREPELEDVRALVLSSLGKPTGEIRTSNELVNRLFQNILWSQYGNSLSIPTDCPQRNERMGWAGDAQVFVSTALMNADAYGFYRRYLLWMRDCQLENGQYPCIAPVGGGFGGIAWESAGIIIPYTLWQHYGDDTILRENYPAMCRYIGYLQSRGEIGRLTGVGPLGDWLASDYSTDTPLLWNAVALYDLKLMEEMASALDETADAARFAHMFSEGQKIWNETFVHPVSRQAIGLKGKSSHTQCAYALPLEYGILLEENRAAFQRHLVARIEETGHAVTTGFLGTGPLNPALTHAGRPDTAYAVLLNTRYPSWLYSVLQGATTIWERWNSYTVENGFGGNNTMNSFNHYSLGAVGKWMYTSVLGIGQGTAPSWEHFRLEPQIQCLDWAEGHFDSPCGRIESAWRRTGHGHASWSFCVPAGTSAQVILPSGARILSGGENLEVAADASLWAGSGRYSLELEITP